MNHHFRENTEHSFVRQLKQSQQIELNEKLKTLNSNQSMLDYRFRQQIDFNHDQTQKIDQHQQQIINVQTYCKWLKTLSNNNSLSPQLKEYLVIDKQKQKLNKNQKQEEEQKNYILFQMNSISNISFQDFSNRLESSKQQLIKVIFTLQNPSSGHLYSKKIVSPLLYLSENQASKIKQFSINQKFSLFLHTSLKKAELKIQIIGYELIVLQNGLKIVNKQQILGGTIIPLLQNKQSKMKRKKNLSKIQHFFQSFQTKTEIGDQSNKKNLLGTITYNVINSPYMKIISKLIPQNTIYWFEDFVPCLLGNHLPKTDDIGFQLNPSTQNFSLSLDIQNVLIPTNLITDALTKFESTMNKKYKNMQIKTFQKGLKIKLFFHNGLKIVEFKISNLTQKMQIQKKIKNKKGLKQDFLITLKQYSSNILFLPTAFFQDNCLLGIQIYLQAEMIITKKFNQTQSKNIKQFQLKNTRQSLKHLIPIAFTFINCQKILSNQQVQRVLIPGCFFKCQPLKIVNNIKNHQQFKSTKILQSNKNIEEQQDHNYSVIILKFQIKEGQFGQEWKASAKLEDKLLNQMFGDKSYLKNDSMKIANQKDKMVKGYNIGTNLKGKHGKNLALKEQIHKMQSVVEQEQFLTTNFRAKQAQLLTLKVKLDLLKKVQKKKNQNSTSSFQQFVLKNKAKTNQSIQNQRIYKKLIIKAVFNYEMFVKKFSKKIKQMTLFILKQSVFQNYQQCYQQIPTEILKTNLIESNIKYLIFINPISLFSVTSNSNKFYLLPNKFFIKIFFWNYQYYSPLLTIDPLTGEIIISSSQKNKQAKIFNLQVFPDKSFVNYQQYLMSFIQYTYNGVVQVQIIDQNTTLFGNSWFKLRKLVQKIKTENMCTEQQEVYSQSNGLIGKLKLDFKYIKRQATVLTTKNPIQQQAINISELFNENSRIQKIDKQNSQTFNKILPSNQLQRIKNFKKKVKERYNEQSKELSFTKQSNLIQNKEEHEQNKIIEAKYQQNVQKTIERQYLIKQYKLKVSMFKKEIFFVQLQNKFNQSGNFNIQISDEDMSFYNILYPQELTIIRSVNHIPKSEQHKFMTIPQNKQKLLKHKQIQENFQIFLQPYQKVSVICQYHTYRKFIQDSSITALQIANRQHSIIISLLLNKQVSSIVKINVFPQPIKQIIKIDQYIDEGKQYLIEMPFKQEDLERFDVMIDSSKALLVTQAKKQNLKKLQQKTHLSSQDQSFFNQQSNLQTDKNRGDSIRQSLFKKSESFSYRGNEQLHNSQLFLQVKKQSSCTLKTINIYFIPKQINSFNHKDATTQNNQFTQKTQVKALNIIVNLFSAKQFIFKIGLFETVTQKLYLQHKDLVQNQNLLKTVGIASESQYVTFDKFWHKINGKFSETIINTQITSLLFGKMSYTINILNPNKYNEMIKKQNGFQIDSCILHRYLVTVVTSFPSLRQVITLNINERSTQIMQEWFSYTNNYNQKTIFEVWITDSSLISVAERDSMIEVNGKGQKKLKLIINSKNIVQKNRQKSSKQIVILGFKCEKGIDYFGFKFNIK